MSAPVRAILVSLALCLPGCLELGGSATSATGPAFDTYGCFRVAGRHDAALATDTDTTTSSGDPEVLTTGTTAPEDYEAMDACPIAPACETVWHQTAEPPHEHNADYYPPNEVCLLEGLRDSRPGAYRSIINPVWANGSITDTHILHVGFERRVTVVHHHLEYRYYGPSTEIIDDYYMAQSCRLVDSEFFTSCLASYDDFDHLFDCLKPELWLRDCVDAEPWCPCSPEGT